MGMEMLCRLRGRQWGTEGGAAAGTRPRLPALVQASDVTALSSQPPQSQRGLGCGGGGVAHGPRLSASQEHEKVHAHKSRTLLFRVRRFVISPNGLDRNTVTEDMLNVPNSGLGIQ